MCTVSIKVDENLLERAGIKMDSDVEIAEWMRQQIETILIRMALSAKNKAKTTSHSWDNYELSPESLAMAPKTRYDIYGDYKVELTNLLEEKYK